MSFWILDTDHVSLFQRGNLEIARRLNSLDSSEIAITIITVEEQLRGRFQVIRRAAPDQLVSAYQKLQVTFDSLKSFNVLRFTAETQEIYTNLINQKIKVAQDQKTGFAVGIGTPTSNPDPNVFAGNEFTYGDRPSIDGGGIVRYSLLSVPEPSTISGLAVLCLGLLLKRREMRE